MPRSSAYAFNISLLSASILRLFHIAPDNWAVFIAIVKEPSLDYSVFVTCPLTASRVFAHFSIRESRLLHKDYYLYIIKGCLFGD